GGPPSDRVCAREAGVSAARAVHGRALGDDDVTAEGMRMVSRAALTLLAVAAIYEAVARSGLFPTVLLPTLPVVARTLYAMLADGSMPMHALYTLERVLIGCGLAVALGLPLGILMGRYRQGENFVLPLASALVPIPSLAWGAVVIPWVGLGHAGHIPVALYSALVSLLLHTC